MLFRSDMRAIWQSTYLGTSAYDQAYFVELDENENVYLAGQSEGSMPIQPAISSGKTSIYSNPDSRSEERRVGKECRSRWSPYH